MLCTDDLKVISIRSSLFIVKVTVVVRQNKMINKPEIMGNAGSPFFFSLTRTFSVNTEPDWYDSERWWMITRWSMPNISSHHLKTMASFNSDDFRSPYSDLRDPIPTTHNQSQPLLLVNGHQYWISPRCN